MWQLQQPMIPIIRVSTEEDRARNRKIIFEYILARNFPNSMETVSSQIQVDKWTQTQGILEKLHEDTNWF